MNRSVNYITAADAMDVWRENVLTGKPPTFYRIAELCIETLGRSVELHSLPPIE